MLNIKFINATSAILVNSVDPENIIAPSNEGVFTVTEPLSKNNVDYYHFVITGLNVQVSGVIDSVSKKQEFCNLFKGCTQITDASNLVLSAPNMKESCYANMFIDCTNLTTPPQIQAQTLDMWCFQNMFAGCEKLSAAPVLSATTLAPYCYYAMFYGCKSLSTSPYLPAETLTDWCYNSMFYNCYKLTSISALFSSWGENATTNWVTGIDTNGVFYDKKINIQYGVDNIPENWTEYYSSLPLTFTGKAASNAVSLVAVNQVGNVSAVTLDYKKNDGEWVKYTVGDIIELELNLCVSFSGANEYFTRYSSDYYNFAMTGIIEADGNIQSLINYSNTVPNYAFLYLFYSCSSLVTPPQLPAKDVGHYGYWWMFRDCTSLTSAPDLPVTGLGNNCFSAMFAGCTSLTTISFQLPATTLVQGCYNSMFYYCSSLVSVPSDMLPATSLYQQCYGGMFAGCKSLTSAPALPATSLAYGCYAGMFRGCTALSTPPELPATELADYCYYEMFQDCSNLVSASLPATGLVSLCYRSMFRNCTSLTSINVNFTKWNENATSAWVYKVSPTGTFYKPSTLSTVYGSNYIPSSAAAHWQDPDYKWTVVNK